jgi:hypothetical protein
VAGKLMRLFNDEFQRHEGDEMKSNKYFLVYKNHEMFLELIFTYLLVMLCSVSYSFAAGRQKLHGHLPKDFEKAKIVGDLSERDQLTLAIGLPMRNQKAFNQYMKDIHDPKSPQYRHHLTSDEFAKKFDPTSKDYQALINFMKSNGLTVTDTFPDRTLLGVSGSIGDIQKIFHVLFHYYQLPNGTKFRSPDREPSVDLEISLSQIDGLDDLTRPVPASK